MREIIEYLDPKPGQKILDCTLGGGGHAKAILERIIPDGTLIGIDCDGEALNIARGNLEKYKANIFLVEDNYKNFENVLLKLDIGEADGYIFDLGISSFQIERRERGFSIKLDGPLDMRMDKALKVNAAVLVNSLDQKKIAEILKEFGEERFSGRIAKAIVSKRPIRTTGALASIVASSVPARYRAGRIHPATRTFQALRIAVNGELDVLRSALDALPGRISKGGRVCVISFHSLEDRIVKHKFRELAEKGLFKIITKRPVVPQPDEISGNPRSRSAKLRVAEMI